MAAHREVIGGACRRLGVRGVRQTLVDRERGLYRTSLTLWNGDVVVAEGAGVEASFGHALLQLETRRQPAGRQAD
jgi:hypothetical protein